YMLRERQRDELEACERKRLLNSAAYNQTGLIRMICNGIVDAVHRLRKQRYSKTRLLHPCCSIVRDFVRTRGGAR
ncbi:MAG: hypothetical protein ACN4GW_20700, partial [Desulforhopalus sp.]